MVIPPVAITAAAKAVGSAANLAASAFDDLLKTTASLGTGKPGHGHHPKPGTDAVQPAATRTAGL